MSEIKRTKAAVELPSLKERGIAAARRGITSAVPWSALVAQLRDDFGVARSTAARWVRDARQEDIRESTDIDPADTESVRWDTIARWAKLRMVCEAEALALLDGAKGKTSKRKALPWLQQAQRYDRDTAKLLHHDLVPPDRDLDQPEIMAQAIASMLRHLSSAPRDQLRVLRDQIDIVLEQGHGEDEMTAMQDLYQQAIEADAVL